MKLFKVKQHFPRPHIPHEKIESAAYHGPLESGVMKMLVIGLGKHEQALEIHNYGTKGLKDSYRTSGSQVWEYSSRNCDCGKIDVLIIDEFGKDISGVGLEQM